MWFEKFDFHGYSSNRKLDDCKTRNVRLAKQRDQDFLKDFLQTKIFWKPLDIVRERLSQFDVILEVWLPGAISTWKFAILKEEISYWPGNEEKWRHTVRGLEVLSLNLMWFEKFGSQR